MAAGPHDARAAIVGELEQLLNDVRWTEKGHFASASVLRGLRLTLGVIATAAASVAAATIFTDKPGVAGVFALVSALFSGLLTFLKPEEAASRHLNTGRRLNALVVDIRQTLTIDAPAEEIKELRARVAQVACTKAEIDESAPHIPNLSIRWAGRRITRGDFSFERPGHRQAR
ncbi:SLATT domain-containing protein [Micromonospora sp. NPDC049891]|uniref:SLATT domain-containing protein n=1 Tax=Micromonospora sp. NPDC049891 TaxID=3155655 RepID=UPI0033F228C8